MLNVPGGNRVKAMSAVFKGDPDISHKRSLCNDLNSELYKDQLLELGKELGLSLTNRHTKKEICEMISELIAGIPHEAQHDEDEIIADQRLKGQMLDWDAELLDLFNNGTNNKFNPYSEESVNDMVSGWAPGREEPIAQIIIRHILLTSLPAKIREMRAYIGPELEKWTNHKWNDAEYAHLFIMDIARNIELFVNDKSVNLTIGPDTYDYTFSDTNNLIKILRKVYDRIAKYIQDLFQIKPETLQNAEYKSSYLKKIQKTVGIDRNGKIENPNLNYIREMQGLLQ